MSSVRRTVDIEDDVRAAIDRLRQERGTSMKEIVNEALRRGLEEQRRLEVRQESRAKDR